MSAPPPPAAPPTAPEATAEQPDVPPEARPTCHLQLLGLRLLRPRLLMSLLPLGRRRSATRRRRRPRDVRGGDSRRSGGGRAARRHHGAPDAFSFEDWRRAEARRGVHFFLLASSFACPPLSFSLTLALSLLLSRFSSSCDEPIHLFTRWPRLAPSFLLLKRTAITSLSHPSGARVLVRAYVFFCVAFVWSVGRSLSARAYPLLSSLDLCVLNRRSLFASLHPNPHSNPHPNPFPKVRERLPTSATAVARVGDGGGAAAATAKVRQTAAAWRRRRPHCGTLRRAADSADDDGAVSCREVRRRHRRRWRSSVVCVRRS